MFSPAKIQSVTVQIDDGERSECRHINGPLYVLKWNPSIYLEGMHEITVLIMISKFHADDISNLMSFLWHRFQHRMKQGESL